MSVYNWRIGLTVLIFAIIVVSPRPSSAQADNKVRSAVAGIVSILHTADQAGKFNCGLHLGRRQCGSQDRCQQTLSFAQQAASGSHEKITDLENYRVQKGAHETCLRSLVGYQSSALIRHLRQHAQELRRLHQLRSQN